MSFRPIFLRFGRKIRRIILGQETLPLPNSYPTTFPSEEEFPLKDCFPSLIVNSANKYPITHDIIRL